MSEKVDTRTLVWRGITMGRPDRDCPGYWRESNPESEWSVDRDGDGYSAYLNISWSENGDWESICEGRGVNPTEALEAARVAVAELLPKVSGERAAAIETAVAEFMRTMEEIECAYPTEGLRDALERTRVASEAACTT